jgi:hypothetical protein
MVVSDFIGKFVEKGDCPEYQNIDKAIAYIRIQEDITLELTIKKQVSSQQNFFPLPVPVSVESLMTHITKGRKSAIRSEYGTVINSENYIYLDSKSGKVLIYSFSIKKTSVPIIFVVKTGRVSYEERTLEFIRKGEEDGKTASQIRQLNNGISNDEVRESIVQTLINDGSIKKRLIRNFERGKPTTKYIATEFFGEEAVSAE